MILMGNLADIGWLIMLFFGLMAFGFSGYRSLNSYVFTAMIFFGVTWAMYYPRYFVEIGDFKMTDLIIPLIQIIMFGMGTSMSVKDFAGVIISPKGVLVGVTAQLGIMPLMGFVLAKFSGFPPEIAAGIVLIGSSPSGVASNVMAYLAKANLALSITITSIATLLAPFVTPLLMKLLAGEFVEIDVLAMMWSIVKMIIIPIGAGIVVQPNIGGQGCMVGQGHAHYFHVGDRFDHCGHYGCRKRCSTGYWRSFDVAGSSPQHFWLFLGLLVCKDAPIIRAGLTYHCP